MADSGGEGRSEWATRKILRKLKKPNCFAARSDRSLIPTICPWDSKDEFVSYELR